MAESPPLHLASASPRRRDVLRSLGLEFSYGGEDLDEARGDREPAGDMVLRLAGEKAASAAARYHDRAILGADTAVVLDDTVFGKPGSRDEALDMLARLSGRTHEVMTGVAVAFDGGLSNRLCVTEVRFREIGRAEALAYWDSGEARDKAGGYAIQGLGGVFAETLRGSYSGVVGLPAFETAALLAAVGIDVLSPRAGDEP